MFARACGRAQGRLTKEKVFNTRGLKDVRKFLKRVQEFSEHSNPGLRAVELHKAGEVRPREFPRRRGIFSSPVGLPRHSLIAVAAALTFGVARGTSATRRD